MLGLKFLQTLRGVRYGDRILVRYSKFFGRFGMGIQIFKISVPSNLLGTLDQVRWLRRFKYGFVYRGWFKDSSIFKRIYPSEGNSNGMNLAYIILDNGSAFILEGDQQDNLLKDASLHPSFEKGDLFVKIM